MLHAIINWIFGFEFTNLVGVILYWIPLSICAVGYTIKTWSLYQFDIKNKDNDSAWPAPQTVGDLVNRFIATVLPIMNIISMIFDIMPDIFSRIGKLLDIPLVPRSKKKG